MFGEKMERPSKKQCLQNEGPSKEIQINILKLNLQMYTNIERYSPQHYFTYSKQNIIQYKDITKGQKTTLKTMPT